MELNIVGRHVGITDRFRAYVTEKSEKVAHLADRAIVLEVKLSRHERPGSHERSGHPGSDRVELTLIGKGPVIRAEAAGSDKYAAFDVALGRLLERVRRAKDRRRVRRGGGRRPTSLREATEGGFADVAVHPAAPDVLDPRVRNVTVESAASHSEPLPGAEVGAEHRDDQESESEYSPVVIREKVFAAEAMSVDEALYFMELVGHDFYLFRDSESGRASVVYRRKGWNYGLIGLDEQGEPGAPGPGTD